MSFTYFSIDGETFMASLSGISIIILSRALLQMALSISRFAIALLGGKGGKVLYTLSIAGSADAVGFGALGVDCRSMPSRVCRSVLSHVSRSTLSLVHQSISLLSSDSRSWSSRSSCGSSSSLV
ncbi:hypothetical protein F2Q70_00003665 [Brassica cretica]|uniref:Uncharacterized protein n=1 Tax=Brassica cretica TaxID=69181 RepID=A0A8S9IYJ5_BRACR|nr:hypothetical protein F2Q70_00003665 [Brassica cretica]